MLEAHLIIYFLLVLLQVFSGILANGLIVRVNGAEWIMQRKIASLDLLLFCLAISRILLQLHIFGCQLSFHLLVTPFLSAETMVTLSFTNELSLWFATWLGVFYCAKIATVRHPLFLWLKTRISRLVPWLILGSLLYTVAMCSIYSKPMMETYQSLFMNLITKNSTHIPEIDRELLSYFIFGFTVPLSIFLVAGLLLTVSLVRHAHRMRTVKMGTRGPSRHAHLSAVLSILSFVILYFSHYLVIMLLSCQVLPFDSIAFLFCTLMVGAYPSVHSTILILGNPKLKQRAKMSLLHCKCCQ
uniref:taste receptor type 2 member 1 n=1 Tax=Jaculus jaculus TaxID=51337 RepID=UPI001E1B0857|nr:taste receptor type 2 member 1 [Jaculus jaculus]